MSTAVVMMPTPRQTFATRLQELQARTVESLLEMGRLLIEAKADLPHGEWTAMVEGDLGMNMNAVQRLMQVAGHPVLSKAATLPLLPPSREALYQLAQLPPERLEAALADGTVTPGMTMQAARQLRRPAPGPCQMVTLGPVNMTPPAPEPPPTAEGIAAELVGQVQEFLAEQPEEMRAAVLAETVAKLTDMAAQLAKCRKDDAVVDIEAAAEDVEGSWRCSSCEAIVAEEDLVVARECSRESCGSVFAATDGNSCPECNNPFTRRLHDHACPECGDAESECEPGSPGTLGTSMGGQQ